jgi:hypothetical protein
MPFLFLNESPNLVALNIPYRDIDDQAAHQRFAFFTGQGEQPHDGISIQIRDAFRGANRVAFDQEAKNEHYFLLGNIAAFERRFVGFGVCRFAGRATKSLKAIAVFAEALT